MYWSENKTYCNGKQDSMLLNPITSTWVNLFTTVRTDHRNFTPMDDAHMQALYDAMFPSDSEDNMDSDSEDNMDSDSEDNMDSESEDDMDSDIDSDYTSSSDEGYSSF